eukprot:691715-Ditylum_brightwellii.AAC.1
MPKATNWAYLMEMQSVLGSEECDAKGNKLGLLDGDAVVLEVIVGSLDGIVDGIELGSKEGTDEGDKRGLLDGDAVALE